MFIITVPLTFNATTNKHKTMLCITLYAGIYMLFIYRGKEFRVEYSYLSELRSLIPCDVHVMALTATASDTVVSHIIRDTGMINPVMIQILPDKKNLRFGVHYISSMEEVFMPLAMPLKRYRTSFKRTIVFCQ